MSACQNNNLFSALGIPIKWMCFEQLDKCILIHKELLLFSGPYLIQLLINQASQKCFLYVIPLQLYFLITIFFFLQLFNEIAHYTEWSYLQACNFLIFFSFLCLCLCLLLPLRWILWSTIHADILQTVLTLNNTIFLEQSHYSE